MSEIQLSDAVFTANDEVVVYAAGTLKFKEGFGDQTMRAGSAGGGKVGPIPTNDLSTAFGSITVELPTTPNNVALVRGWQAAGSLNVFTIEGSNASGNFTRTFQKGTVTADPDVAIGPDGNISVEIQSQQAIG